MLSPVVMFPMDLLEKGFAANNFGMLGLGDIVIPGMHLVSSSLCTLSIALNSPFAGLLIALLCRFDHR